jgi:hypothetical protein
VQEGEYEKGVDYLRRAVGLTEAAFGKDHSEPMSTWIAYVEALIAAKHYPTALQVAQKFLKTMKELDSICFHCRKETGKYRCGRCKQVNYCSSMCQKADWSKHKPVCHVEACDDTRFFQKKIKIAQDLLVEIYQVIKANENKQKSSKCFNRIAVAFLLF